MIYKGIIFDDFVQDENGNRWAEICNDCARKYADRIADELDDGGTASGFCSVKGCHNNGANAAMHFYIDFEQNLVEFEEGKSGTRAKKPFFVRLLV